VGIAVGEATRAAAPEFVYRELDLVRVKGKNEPVAIFQPLGKPEQVDAAAMAALATWTEALALVRAQRWNAAEALIGELQTAGPDLPLYALYRQRIALYRASPPGPDWDGVTSFDSK
jgi:adenylate cyclase